MAIKKSTFAKYDNNARCRVMIERVSPQIEQGLYPIKRVEGEWVTVEADVFGDGHDLISVFLLFRKAETKKWSEVRMSDKGNDRWTGSFRCETIGEYEYAIKSFIDHPRSWFYAFRKRLSENEVKELELQVRIGIEYLNQIAELYPKSKKEVKQWIERLKGENPFEQAASVELEKFLYDYPLLQFETITDKVWKVIAHRKRAGYGAWYSFFPRSAAPKDSPHGTFKDCEDILPRIAEMGFDVVYLTPIHPIGDQFRKGKNNSVNAQPGEVGCPYAIGSELGGHKDILPELGTLKDFQSLVKKTKALNMEVALDFAIQCAPDHPYVKEHPSWFKWRPDGTVQYAENPPKKYQDILPVDFETEDWQGLWQELKSILDYWIAQGVTIFRVDNPHTKSFPFWEWCLGEMHKSNPEVLFLSEAFTRPRVMEALAKKGFHQSYTYFTWRNTKQELSQYMNDLTQTELKEYYRPNFWTNTQDILPYMMQSGQLPQFLIRYFLAATLSSNYGIFGPTFELMVHAALPGREEYLDSEKYEVRHWDWTLRNRLTEVITAVNKHRKENEALQFTNNYTACQIDNEQLIAYLKTYADNKILCIVNLDAYSRQSASVHVPLHLIGKNHGDPYTVHDLITGEKYIWHGSMNYIELDPYKLPFHLFRIEG